MSITRQYPVKLSRLWSNRPTCSVASTVLTAKPHATGRTHHHVVMAQKQTAYEKHNFLLERGSSLLVLDLAPHA
jgi:hypothetical protein